MRSAVTHEGKFRDVTHPLHRASESAVRRRALLALAVARVAGTDARGVRRPAGHARRACRRSSPNGTTDDPDVGARAGRDAYDVRSTTTVGFNGPPTSRQHGQQLLRADDEPPGRHPVLARPRPTTRPASPAGLRRRDVHQGTGRTCPVLVSPAPTAAPAAARQPAAAHLGPRRRAPSSYKVEVDGDSDFVGATTYTTKSTSLVVPDPLGAGDWYWRVTASKGNGLKSAPSEARRFVDRPPSPRPCITSPPDDADSELQDVVLDWDPVPGAVSYEVQVATDSRLHQGALIDAADRHPRHPLLPADHLRQRQYFWRVRAIDSPARPPRGRAARSTSPATGRTARRASTRPPPAPRTFRRRSTSSGPGPARLRVRDPGRHPGELHRRHVRELPHRRHDLHARHVRHQHHRHPGSAPRTTRTASRRPARSTTGACARSTARSRKTRRHPRRPGHLLRDPGLHATLPHEHHRHGASSGGQTVDVPTLTLGPRRRRRDLRGHDHEGTTAAVVDQATTYGHLLHAPTARRSSTRLTAPTRGSITARRYRRHRVADLHQRTFNVSGNVPTQRAARADAARPRRPARPAS